MNRALFEKFCAQNEFAPLDKVETKHGTILLAEGWFSDRKDEYPHGYIQTIAAVDRDGIDVINYGEWDALHNANDVPLNERQRARVRSVIQRAEEAMADNAGAGRYG